MSMSVDFDASSSKRCFYTPQMDKRKVVDLAKCRSMETLKISNRAIQKNITKELDKLATLMDQDCFAAMSFQQKILLQDFVLNRKDIQPKLERVRRISNRSVESNDSYTPSTGNWSYQDFLEYPKVIAAELGVKSSEILSNNSFRFKRQSYYIGWKSIYYSQRKEVEVMICQKGSIPLGILQGQFSKLSAKVSLENSKEQSVTLVKTKDRKMCCHVLRFACGYDEATVEEKTIQLRLFLHQSMFRKRQVVTIEGVLGKSGHGAWWSINI